MSANYKTKKTLPFKKKNRGLIDTKEPIYNEHISIGNEILMKFSRRPNFIGQIDAATGKTSTFEQMKERSVKCALWLRKLKVKFGDVITVCTHNQLEAYVPYLAALYIGAIVNPWPKRKKGIRSNAEYFLTRVTPKVIFVDCDNVRMIQAAVVKMNVSTKIVVFGDGFDEFESLELILQKKFNRLDINQFSCVKMNIKDPAIILLSCGTTGFLKDVEVPYKFFLNSSNQIPIMNSNNDVGLWFESLDWIISLLLTVRAILMGVKVIKSPGFLEEHHLCQIIRRYKVTWIYLKTDMCNRLSRFDILEKYDTSSLKMVIFGGLTIKHNVHTSLIQSLPNVSIIQLYCLPETGVIAYQRGTMNIIGSIGCLVKNVRLLITDCATKEPVGPYTIGVIWCQSSSMMNGYYKDSRYTRIVIDDNGWFRSEDVGYYDEHGNVFVIDRVKQLINYRNYYISPAEIEIALQSHPFVSEAAVVPLSHDYDNFRLVTFIAPEPGLEQKEELQKFITETFVGPRCLQYIYFMKQLPHISDEIINRKHLSKLAIAYTKLAWL
ncbi:uncharacterized protein [Temnothorax longispinosus]|uniref:uncharacterized protein n=1 Tax=Temnothorax longispinosus TaxID=300112 RepID=UPI003A9A06EA